MCYNIFAEDIGQSRIKSGFRAGVLSKHSISRQPLFILGDAMKRLPFSERFWGYVKKTDTCWLWNGYKSKGGYGRIKNNRRFHFAHRVSWEFVNGKIPNGLLVLHKCDVRNCVNPDHLFLGTHADNNHDMYAKGRGRGARSGEAHHNAKLNEKQIAEIRSLRSNGLTLKEIADVYGINFRHVSRIVNFQRWRKTCQSQD